MSFWFLTFLAGVSGDETADIRHTLTAVTPHLSRQNRNTYARCIQLASQKYQLDWRLMVTVIKHESNGHAKKISRTHDYGLGQIHCPSDYCQFPPTPEERKRLLDPCSNIRLTARVMAQKRESCTRIKSKKVRRICERHWIGMYNANSPGYLTRILELYSAVRAVTTHPPEV